MLTACAAVQTALVRQAWREGAHWFLAGGLEGTRGRDVVLGQGDSNLANFLWDSNRIRIVDVEDSGPSDRAFELAVLVEHLSAWSDAGLAADNFLGCSVSPLPTGEGARVPAALCSVLADDAAAGRSRSSPQSARNFGTASCSPAAA